MASLRSPLSVFAGYSVFFLVFFAPVLFSNQLLAPGDGISYFLPNFYSRRMLWDTSIWGGFPAVGDPQRMFWYPPAYILSLIPNTWNVFVILAYVFAASFTYGYTYSLTRSRLAAAVSGLIYGLSGFMISHIGHAAIVHTTAWLPMIVWAYSEIARQERFDRRWFAIGTIAVACAMLAGHPQMFTYVLIISALFILTQGLATTVRTLRYYVKCGASLLIGVGLAAIQLVPTIELAPYTLRASLTFQDFVAYQLPLRQLPMIIFPFLYGGAPASFYGTPYFGAWPSSSDGWGASELTGYVGLLPLMLAGAGFVFNKRNVLVWFWCGIALLSLMLVIGESTPLGFITYHIPLLNKFRAPARYFFVFAFAVSVLAGFGVGSFMNGSVTKRVLFKIVTTATLIMTACFAGVYLFSGKINELAIQRLGQLITLNPWKNPSLLIPLVIFFSALLTLLLWQRRHISRPRIALVVLILLLDLASFSWFYEWRYRSPYSAYLEAPAAFDDYRAEIERNQQRVLPVRGGLGRVSELPPDLSKLWQIPSASGYGPFVLTRLNHLLSMQPHGSIDETWREPANQGLDLLGVRYVLMPQTELEAPAQIDERGLRWSTQSFSKTIGEGCGPEMPLTVDIELQQPVQATRVGMVGTLACSVELSNGVEFAQMILTDSSGHDEVHSLRAGEHFSEWAWDCSDVRPAMQHTRANVFSNWSAERDGVRCEAHDYIALFPIQQVREIKQISLRWTGPAASFALRKITLIDDGRLLSFPVPPDKPSLTDSTRWRLLGNIDGSNSGYGHAVPFQEIGAALIYENLRAVPRAWLVAEVLAANQEEAVRAIRESRLPDGRRFDAQRLALVENTPPVLESGQISFDGSARVKFLGENVMEVETNSNVPAFLVTSDVNYPGWAAAINGQPTKIYQTNYLLRGVAVPAGNHLVRFEFRPRSFYLGALLSTGSLLLFILVCALRPAAAKHQGAQKRKAEQ